jgi:hypothetical protein
MYMVLCFEGNGVWARVRLSQLIVPILTIPGYKVNNHLYQKGGRLEPTLK